jgi:hypothetical protein
LENVIIYVALSQFIARWRSLVVITALGAQYFSFWMGWAGAERLFGMMTLFAVGFIYRPWVYKFVERPRPLIALAAVATYIVGDLYFFSWGDRNLSHDRGSLLKIAMSAVGLLWWLQIAVIFSKAPLLGPELRRVGALVLPIYLLHTLVLGVLSTLARPLTRHMNIHIASLMSLWAFGFVGIYGAVFMFKAFRRVPGVFFPPRCFFRFIDTTIERLRRAGYADNSHSRIK